MSVLSASLLFSKNRFDQLFSGPPALDRDGTSAHTGLSVCAPFFMFCLSARKGSACVLVFPPGDATLPQKRVCFSLSFQPLAPTSPRQPGVPLSLPFFARLAACCACERPVPRVFSFSRELNSRVRHQSLSFRVHCRSAYPVHSRRVCRCRATGQSSFLGPKSVSLRRPFSRLSRGNRHHPSPSAHTPF